MAMTELLLVFLGSLATLSSIGLFLNVDAATNALLGLVGAILWLVTGISAFDVRMPNSTASEPVTAIAFVGIGLGVVTGLFGLLRLMAALRDETPGTADMGALE